MTDLEMTKLCAEAMKLEWRDCPELTMNGQPTIQTKEQRRDYHEWRLYDPLKRDAQAMALVKKFGIRSIRTSGDLVEWSVTIGAAGPFGSHAMNADLNRAIVECVAKLQSAKL